ncbi:hypothetical protein WJX74_009150 [Apatococcus lobatus]|uniref:HMA domain-containing protein n=1 Tax=Apatococcus lobatus TaxID=904363 RepID=A0AAW1QZ30_9CHLO
MFSSGWTEATLAGLEAATARSGTSSGGGGGGSGGSSSQHAGGTPFKAQPHGNSKQAEEVILMDISGMRCGGCVRSVTRLLEQQPHVRQAVVNLPTETALVYVIIPKEQQHSKDHDAFLEQIGQRLTQVLLEHNFACKVRDRHGSTASAARVVKAKQQERVKRLEDALKRLAVAGMLASACFLGHLAHLWPGAPRLLHLLGSPRVHGTMSALALIGPGRKLVLDGFQALCRGAPNMNTLVGLGATASFGISCIAAALPGLGWRTFFEEPAMLLGVVLVGRALEERAQLQASSDLAALQGLLPSRARLILAGSDWQEVPAEAVSPGDLLAVLPGDRVPVDGCVISGCTTIDESALTGEAMPVGKSAGEQVTAGTVNCDGSIVVRSERAGDATVMADILRLVDAAQSRTAPMQRLADSVAGRFTYAMMGLSAATFLFWSAVGTRIFPQVLKGVGAAAAGNPRAAGLLLSLQLACNVLVVACPCALGLAAPTAVLVGTSSGARRGLLIRGGDVLEAASHTDTVIFDKTGTLTRGKPAIRSITPATPELSAEDILAYAACVERQTSHPVAHAIVSASDAQGLSSHTLDAGSLYQEPGQGVSGTCNGVPVAVGVEAWVQRQMNSLGASTSSRPAGEASRRRGSSNGADSSQAATSQARYAATHTCTQVWVGVGGRMAGQMLLSDEVRPDAAAVVAGLQKRGLHVLLLSGDREAPAQAVAAAVGIPSDAVHAGVKPAGKAQLVQQLQKQGRCVAMVGDGINDAGALAEATVGIAMGGGVDAAAEVAGIVLLGDRVSQVLDAVQLSQATFAKIKQNLGWAFGYNIIGIPLAAGALLPSAGIALTPTVSGALMGLSSIFVMGNSLLLQLEGPSHMPAADSPPDKQRSHKQAKSPVKAAKGIIKSANPANHVCETLMRMIVKLQFINGHWVSPASGNALAVVSPIDDAVVGEIPAGNAADVEAAVQAAAVAYKGPWGQTSGKDRAVVLKAIADLLKKKKTELAKLETLDMGKPIQEAEWDLDDAAGCFEYYADLAERLDKKQWSPVDVGTEDFKTEIRQEPLGVVALITPWNYPLLMAVWKVAPALAAGNTIVLKPSEMASLTCLELGALAREAGLPAGVLNVITGLGPDAGAPLSEHPAVAKVAFTGSSVTGRRVAMAAAKNLRPATMELGGKSALVIFEDADVAKAVEWAMFGCFWGAGQVCSATSRVLVQSSIAEAFHEQLKQRAEEIKICDPNEPECRLGPVVNQAQYDKILKFIEDAKTEGADLLTGGGRPEHLPQGRFIKPTAFTRVKREHRLWREEVFGPVLAVASFETEEEAVALANESEFGLAAAVISEDEERCRRVAKAMEAGIVWIGCSQPAFCQAPWGGMKNSGHGRELGEYGMASFLNVKQVTTYQSKARWDWYPESKL